MSLIQFSDIRKTYTIGGVTIEALAGVSLDIGEKEFVAIMGPSGSGKVHPHAYPGMSRQPDVR